MINKRKPIPKSQRELSIERQEPYIPPTGAPGFSATGNPNSLDTNTRAEQVSFKGDTSKAYTVGIQDIDEAVMYYFQNVIRPTVYQNGERLVVPVIYGSPEKWKSFQKDGYYRDLQGRIMAPLIMFKRSSLTKDRSLNNKLDANNPHNVAVVGQRYNKKNEYSKFNILNNQRPNKTYYTTVVPDHLTITYECVAFTYYNDQLNKIVEAIEYASDSYWGDPERYKFKATINSFNTTTDLTENSERLVKSTFTLNIYGYIIPDVIQKNLTAARKFSETTKVTFGLETVGGIDTFTATTSPTSPPNASIANIFDSQNITNNVTNITGDIGSISTYLSANNQVAGTYVNPTTITFPYQWLVAPIPLPPTNAGQFVFFVNGQLIEPSAITSFTESGGVSTLIINPAALGFSFISSDEIIGIGKFDI
jgi:hypothetical protein